MELAHAFGFNAKTYVLTAITAERYVMVFSPAWYQLHRPKHFSEIMCTILWGLSGMLAIILYYSCYLETDTLLMETNQHCEPTKVARVIINLLVFLPIMVFSTYLIFTRMLSVSQETPLRRLDITIVATVLLFLIFAASVRIIEIIARWVPKIHIPILFLILHFLDAIDSSGNPYVYLIVGYSKTKTDCEKPLQTLLERALLDDGTTEIMRKRAKPRTEPRIDITLIILVALSFICIVTFQTLGIVSSWVTTLREPTLFHLSLLFDSIKTSINPLVYFFVGNRQRQKTAEPMYKLLERALNDKESTDALDTS
ncbi:hypothetical protein NXF25_002888 [Crotalus adamanteus]|uniref:G-protein coupled receptors family 1 profile domain-containing protein n=1 Tax=Crotalus adamanteus TaxID=8729 RepID=A0AAW1CBN6_CROAD